MVNLLQGEKVNVATLTAKVLNLSSLLNGYILLHVFTLLSSLFLAPAPAPALHWSGAYSDNYLDYHSNHAQSLVTIVTKVTIRSWECQVTLCIGRVPYPTATWAAISSQPRLKYLQAYRTASESCLKVNLGICAGWGVTLNCPFATRRFYK